MIIYKSLDQWENALKSETAPISGSNHDDDEVVNHGWAVCAIGCKIKEELGYDPRKWRIDEQISPKAKELGEQFTKECRNECRKSALKTLNMIRHLPSVFSNLIK